MNSTQATCGHPVAAVGAPGSPVRIKVETAPCAACNDTLEYLRNAIEYAPRNPGQVAPGLRGWWVGAWYVCAKCMGRIVARGCRIPDQSTPCWKHLPEPFGICCLCDE